MRVFGITAGGAQAEFLLTDESLLARIPENLSFAEAAAIPEAFITAQDAIFTQGDLQENETLLIHAVGSGVGLAALQLAKAKGMKVFGTSRTADKLEECEKFGLDEGRRFN
jgi:NADPH:quinone reductase